MNIYRPKCWQDLTVPWTECALIFGSFDGLHLGHQRVIDKLLQSPEKTKVLLIFHPHPRSILSGQSASNKNLFLLAEREEIFRRINLENIIILPFTKEFANLKAKRFVQDFLIAILRTKRLIIGYDQHFGANREGNFQFLQKNHQHDYCDLIVEQVPAQRNKGVFQVITTSRIKVLLEKGKINSANVFLGFPYFLNGMVIKGDQRGSQLGFPTANLQIDSTKLLPKVGVYACHLKHQGRDYYALTNIGRRPTVHQGGQISIEVHILEFPHRELYGETLMVHFLRRIRDEKKFKNLNQLTNQIMKDRKKIGKFRRY